MSDKGLFIRVGRERVFCAISHFLLIYISQTAAGSGNRAQSFLYSIIFLELPKIVETNAKICLGEERLVELNEI